MRPKAPTHDPTVLGALHEAARHQQAGELAKAAAMYRQILKRHPDHPDALHLLGMVTHLMGDTGTAVELIRRVIRRYPDFPEAHNTLGNILKDQGDTPGAVACYRQAVALRPGHVSAHYNLGNCYRDAGNLEQAAACYRRAVEIDPEYAQGHNALGGILRDQDEATEAIACHRRALAINPGYAVGYYGLGCAFQVLGRFDEARAQFERALEIDPDYPAPYQGLAAMRKAEPDDALIAGMQGLLDKAALSRADRILLEFALGKCFDDIGEYDKAFERYRSANELKKRVEPFNPGDFSRRIDRVIETFTRRLVEEKAAFGTGSELPVFVVGMPRSGTTLVEQILASHPRVVGAGELRLISRMGEILPGLLQASVPYPECARLLDAATALRLAQGVSRPCRGASRRGRARRRQGTCELRVPRPDRDAFPARAHHPLPTRSAGYLLILLFPGFPQPGIFERSKSYWPVLPDLPRAHGALAPGPLHSGFGFELRGPRDRSGRRQSADDRFLRPRLGRRLPRFRQHGPQRAHGQLLAEPTADLQVLDRALAQIRTTPRPAQASPLTA